MEEERARAQAQKEEVKRVWHYRSWRCLWWPAAMVLLASAAVSRPALGASSFELETAKDRHHVTADRTLYHSREGVYEAFGHVVLSSQGQRLSADYLWVDEKTQDLKARGNVLFVDKQTTIQAAELHFNLITGFGSIFYGRVSNDLYSLKGQLIRRVSEDRFLTTEGEYTTCKDCAESWKLSARNVDLTVDGYAFMDNVFIKIKDVPTLFLPYVVVPVKTRRQSGLLFPRIGVGTAHGSVFVQPLFLAISDHQDATISVGKYTAHGGRYEGEYRYSFSQGREGYVRIYHTEDRTFKDRMARLGVLHSGARTSLVTENKFPISDGIQLKLRAYEALDRVYVDDFSEDLTGRYLPALESNLVATGHWSNFFVSAEARRYRNLLYDRLVGFDGGMVQSAPTVHAGFKPRSVAGPLLGSFYGRFDRFARHNGPFVDKNRNRLYDRDSELLREANRWILQPELAAPFRLGNYLTLGPSAQYNEIGYSFSAPTSAGAVPGTTTRYLQLRMEASTVLERVFEYDGERVRRLKHQLVPFVSFSSIPWIQQGDNHPFNGAYTNANQPSPQVNRVGGMFDQFDVVPFTNDTDFLRYPQGKSIYYGFTSRLIRKLRQPDEERPRAYPYDQLQKVEREYPKPLNLKQELAQERDRLWEKHAPRYGDYEEVWTVNVSQAYDFKSAARFRDLYNQQRERGVPDSLNQYSDYQKRAFSYAQAKSAVRLDRFSHDLEYRFFPRISSRASYDSYGNLIPVAAGAEPTRWKNKHFISTSFSWDIERLTNLRRTRSLVRSISAGFTNSSDPNRSRTASARLTWSFNDFINAQVAYQYDFLVKSPMDWSTQVTLTHPSECWGLRFNYDWQRAREKKSQFEVKLLLNLDGTGFLEGSQLGRGGGVFGG